MADTLASKVLQDQTNKLNAIQDAISKGQPLPNFPLYSSGARSLMRVGGKSLGVSTDFKWDVQGPEEEIRTIDTNLPWDLSPGQVSITAQINNIIDPSSSMEAIGLFHTMQSIVHGPFVDIQVLDITGTTLFFARGKFTGVSGSVSRGQITNISARFQGVMYQHNVYQGFTPYSTTSLLNSALDAITNAPAAIASEISSKWAPNTKDSPSTAIDNTPEP